MGKTGPKPSWVPGPCSVEGCLKQKGYGRGGYCEMHSKQIRLHGRVTSVAPMRERRYVPGTKCSVTGCDRSAQAKGMCILHYERVHRRGHPEPGSIEPRRKMEKPPAMKKCAMCGEEKPAEAFYLNSTGYLSSRCRVCAKAVALDRRDANLALYRQRSTEWHEKNGARATANRLAWRATNLDRDRITKKAYEERHAAERKRKQQARNASNADLIREQKRAQRAANREAYAVVERRNAELRRARLVGQYVEDIDREAIFARDRGVCQLCGEPVDPSLKWPNPRFATMDHVVRIADGGQHATSNVRLAHLICNQRRR